jgi:phage terminase large subunit-like protein
MGAARKQEETRAEKVIRFCETYLTVPEGAHGGKSVVLREWQKDLLKEVYDTPTRRAIISFGRKNGKTALTAMLVLAHLVGPEARHNSQIYSAAQSRDQAALVFSLAAKMVRMSAILNGAVTVRDSAKELFCARTGVRYKALSADATTAYGLSPVLVIHDELGQVRGPRSELYDALETSMGAQAEPLSIIISTQSPTDADLLSTLIDAARIGDSAKTKCFVYEAALDDEPWDEATWRKANPALGDFLSLEEIKETAEQAKKLPALEAAFRNLHLNQRIAAESHFLSPTVWKLNSDEPDFSLFEDVPVFGGLDLSARNDLTALTLVARDGAGVVHLQCHFFAPGEGLRERAKRDRVPYDLWRDNGLLTATPGASVDYEYVAEVLANFAARCDLREVRFDRWRIGDLERALQKIGVEIKLEPMGQGFKDMSPAIDEFEALAVKGQLKHGGHPILTWNAANAVVTRDAAGNRKLDKSRATGRIDGLVAALMAVASEAGQMEERPAYSLHFV